MGEGSAPSSLFPWSALGSLSGIWPAGFELLDHCYIRGFCGGEALFLNNDSGLEDADSETQKQLTSAFSQCFSALPPAAGPTVAAWFWSIFRRGLRQSQARTSGDILERSSSNSLWSFHL